MAHEGMPGWIPSRQPADGLDLGAWRRTASAGEHDRDPRGAGNETIEDVEGKGFVRVPFRQRLRTGRRGRRRPECSEAAIAEATATGARLWESELHRIAGNLSAPTPQEPTARGAKSHYLRAIEVAREQQARSLELRASASLARLWAKRGEKRKAYDLLAPIYATFTEGFGTPDLIEAKVLLGELD